MSQTALQIVHLDRATIGPAIELHKPELAHHWTSYERTAPEEVIARLDGADVAVLNKVEITAEHIAQLPKLRLIVISATGYDKIDITACKQAGIIVSNIRGYATQTVPEHTIGLILALRRALKGYSADVAAGAWQAANQFCFFNHPIADLKDSTFGLIGSGSIGSEVGRIATAMGMTVLKAGRKGEARPKDGYTPFDEVLETADILSLHCPLTPQTRHLIAADEFAKMTKRPLIINTSRGGLVHENDVIAALDASQIAGAAFDVVTTEPPADDHIFMRNLHRPNFILTPHVAWASDQAMQSLWNQLIGHIDAFAKGTPRNNLCEG